MISPPKQHVSGRFIDRPNPQGSLLGSAMVKACILSGGVAIYFLTISTFCGKDCSNGLSTALTVIGHVIIITAFSFLLLTILRSNRAAIMTPAVGFMACCIIFFGFGNLSMILADDETKYYMMTDNYFLSNSELLRANILTFVGAATIFLSMIFGFKIASVNSLLKGSSFSLRSVALLFLSAGLILKYGVIVPAEWGYADWIVPGTLMNLQPLADIGFMLAVMAIVKGDKTLIGVFLTLWPLHFALCILSFTKETMIVAAIMPVLGAYFGGVRWGKITVFGLLVAGLFVSTQNSFLAARKEVLAFTNTERQSPIEDRVLILGRAFGVEGSGGDIVIDGSALPPQLWWVRLSYAGPQVRAMELFDSGQPLSLLISPIEILVPRVFWPEKPELINLGLTFNRQVSGNNETLGRVAFTIFGEGYWMLGWPGVIFFSAFTGLMFGLISRWVLNWTTNNELLFLPAILLATKTGAIGTLGFFQTGIVLDIILFFIVAALIKSAVLIIRR